MEFDLQKPTNEIGQLIVEMPQYLHRKSNFILIKDEGNDFQILDPGYARSSFRDHSPVGLICSLRAKFTVRGSLLLNNKKVSPQYYLKFWRKVKPINTETLANNHHLKIFADVVIDLEGERADKWYYALASSPLKSFADFEAKYGSLFEPTETPHQVLAKFDLTDAETTFDVEHYLSNSAHDKVNNKSCSTVSFRLVPTDQSVNQISTPSVEVVQKLEQFDLF